MNNVSESNEKIHMLGDFAINLAASLTYDLLKGSRKYLRNLGFDSTAQKALRTVYERAFATMLTKMAADLDTDTQAVLEHVLRQFVKDKDVARQLLNLATMSQDQEPLQGDLLNRFEALGFDPVTLPVDFKMTMVILTGELARELHHTATEDDSPLFNLVNLGRLVAIHTLLKEQQQNWATILHSIHELEQALRISDQGTVTNGDILNHLIGGDQRSTQQRIGQLPPNLRSLAEGILHVTREVQETLSTDRRIGLLHDYLAALRDHCNRLPYITLPGKPLPALSAIYIPQQLEERNIPQQRLWAQDQKTTYAGPKIRTGEQALEHHRHLVLEGEPGVGKSTLLNHLALALITSYFGDRKISLVPVRISVRGLTSRAGSLSQGLHEQVTIELGKRLQEPLPQDFFTHPPFPGASWLILLDGLDEVVEQKMRNDLIQAIDHHVREVRAPYRFVMTTRPLPEIEHLDRTRWGHYVLRPATPNQVGAFAQKWFASRDGSHPDDTAHFLRRVEASRIADLAQVPLLLTMAAVIYERDREKPLPTRRAGLYERYVQILLEDEEAERQTRLSFRRQWDQRYGHEGEVYADRLFNNRRLLLEHLARWQQEGGTGSLVDQTTCYTRELAWIPQAANREWLREQLEMLLQRTGLLTWRSGEQIFMHTTFREYLAASALAREFGPDSEQAMILLAHWSQKNWREVVLFVLGIWSETGRDVDELVKRIWKSGVEGLLFAGAALTEGAQVAPTVESGIVSDLIGHAKEVPLDLLAYFKHPNLFDLLGRLRGCEQIPEKLRDLGNTPEVREPGRLAAAEQLVRLSHIDDAVHILQALTHCRVEGNEWVTTLAIHTLRDLQQADELLAIVRDSNTDDGIRGLALFSLKDIRGAEALRVLVRSPEEEEMVRRAAAKFLVESWKSNELRVLACEPRLETKGRVIIIQVLKELGCDGDLLFLFRNTRLDKKVREAAITGLVLRGKRDIIRNLALDRRVDREGRKLAMAALQLISPERS